jgi:hypothetical protein
MTNEAFARVKIDRLLKDADLCIAAGCYSREGDG